MPHTPRFINPQSTSVGIYCEDGRKRYVTPWVDPLLHRPDGLYVVSGEFYAQYLHPNGPLIRHPDDVAGTTASAPVHANPVIAAVLANPIAHALEEANAERPQSAIGAPAAIPTVPEDQGIPVDTVPPIEHEEGAGIPVTETEEAGAEGIPVGEGEEEDEEAAADAPADTQTPAKPSAKAVRRTVRR